MSVLVESIVAVRDMQPYVCLHVNGEIAQCSIAEARKIAADIVQQAARAEADALILKFFSSQEYPPGAHVAVMMAFRDFRLTLDVEAVEGTFTDPETGEALP